MASTIIDGIPKQVIKLTRRRQPNGQPISIQKKKAMEAYYNSINTGTSPLLKRLTRKAPVHQRIGGVDMKHKRLKYINYQNGLYTKTYQNRLMLGNKFIRMPAQARLDLIRSGFLKKKVILRKQWPMGHPNNLMVRVDNTPPAALKIPIHSVHKLDANLQMDIKLLQQQCSLPNVIPNTRLDGGAATSCTKLTMNARFSTYP